MSALDSQDANAYQGQEDYWKQRKGITASCILYPTIGDGRHLSHDFVGQIGAGDSLTLPLFAETEELAPNETATCWAEQPN